MPPISARKSSETPLRERIQLSSVEELHPSLKDRERLLCAVIRDRFYKKDPNCLLRVYQFNENTEHHLMIEKSTGSFFVPLPSDWYESIPATIVYVVNRLFAHRLRTPKSKDE